MIYTILHRIYILSVYDYIYYNDNTNDDDDDDDNNNNNNNDNHPHHSLFLDVVMVLKGTVHPQKILFKYVMRRTVTKHSTIIITKYI